MPFAAERSEQKLTPLACAQPDPVDPIPDERMGPVEAYLRAWLQPMLAALNAEGGEASPAEEFSTAMAECVDKLLHPAVSCWLQSGRSERD